MTLEVCVDSVQSALNAVQGGAARLELCSCLEVGGLTPSLGLVRRVRQLVVQRAAVFVLVRPNVTERFVYSPDELLVMAEDIRLFREEGDVDGIVVGALTPDGCVDVKAMATLINAAGRLPVTFHRAIDVCRDPIEAVRVAAELGCRRVLTSGQQSTAWQGRKCIKRMIFEVKIFGGRVTIVPGGGICADNLLDIVQATGAKEFHASCKVPIDGAHSQRPPGVTMGSTTIDAEHVCDADKVAALVDILKLAAILVERR